ncbi:MAG: cytochrome c maturation protein CcmE [Rhodospirillales bacterium]|jgi:cytochrome c-type biogenesis protein CcmE|nr:cytochrome c maturation protein CcmE [Rhodospirillales bacterium]HJO72899.1 cytochrome c maturation protein CcmE [Rhodospirillales bacterium]
MKPKHKRFTFVVIAVGLLGAAVALVLVAFEDNIVFFFSPTEVLERKPPPEQRLRVGGLVEEGSVDRSGGARVTFRVTDLANTVAVTYVGLLPDLFREGQGVVVEGYVENGVLRADEVLAKHDETYMPPEVAEALKKSGQWRDTGQGTGDSK